MAIKTIKNEWLPQLSPSIDSVIRGLVREIATRNEHHSPKIKLSKKAEKSLTQAFKNAEQGRSSADSLMQIIAKKMKVESNSNTVFIVPMKDLQRAREKSTIPGRNLNDLGRGTILFSTPAQYEFLKKSLPSLIKNSGIKKATIIKDKIDDYIKKPRKSGYAGGLHTDFEIELTKGNIGNFELQIKPEQYQKADTQSHLLYDMIRILEEIPRNLLTRDHLKVKIALLRANRALFDEEAFKHGYMDIRKQPNNTPTQRVRDNTVTILDHIQQNIDQLRGRKYKWREETKDAITFAKSSIQNLMVHGQRANYRHNTLDI